jgi:hypothetical protein
MLQNHTEEEATWETEEYLNKKYPGFLEATAGTSSTPADTAGI